MNASPTTAITGDEYWDRYFAPDNPIRKWDEQHGIRLVRGQSSGIPTFEAIQEIFRQENAVNIFPSAFENRTIDRFSLIVYDPANRKIVEKAFDMTLNYLQNYDKIVNEAGGGGLYYYSKTRGSGKTYLSTILGNHLTKRGHRVRWFSMPFWLQELRATFDKDSGTSTAQVLNQARNAEVLILDDIGVEKQSAWVNETLFTLLDFRLSTCKPTIFTSNHLPEELSYDERIIDRIGRMSELIRMPEESVRRKLASKGKLASIINPEEAKH